MARKYLIETYGCQMNVHDSERMAGLLEAAGFEPTDADDEADALADGADQRRLDDHHAADLPAIGAGQPQQ